ncbi:DUF1501 domain-containing protein [Schlesneria paludicola]|uniref:DUF1501 domain-containing protein n=1 Tax=Schlesneria paludicola TaxID=360056 RepID=UPI00029A5568|nr:DUF1501 domain-containing protein [Schlesneria paludicola]
MSGSPFLHPTFARRTALQAGGIGLLGLGMNHVSALQAADMATFKGKSTAKSVIYIFLSGGLAQHESFDMKPDAPADIRGDFQPIATSTPGLNICEHLPLLAQRSHLWSLCRSLTHSTNDHSFGHLVMLSGKSIMPPGFDATKPMPSDWPSIASVARAVTKPRNNLPPAAVIPEKLIHRSRRVIPGQFGGLMGSHRDPWFIEASSFDPNVYGAYPQYAFDHQDKPITVDPNRKFQIPDLSLPQGFSVDRFDRRLSLLNSIEQQRIDLDRAAITEPFDRSRQRAISLLTDPKIKRCLDVTGEPAETLDRYGRNSFGWSLLMALNLVEAGVNLVQVNLGNNETWDTHGEMFPHLKNQLLPPTDQALSALLDDLVSRGMLDDTLIVMAGEFGRTPKVSHLPQHYKLPGRDHWGPVQSVFFAGGGTQGGRVVGSTDKTGGYPATDAQRPENLAATIYSALGLPETAAWHDDTQRPHHIFEGAPIAGLF